MTTKTVTDTSAVAERQALLHDAAAVARVRSEVAGAYEKLKARRARLAAERTHQIATEALTGADTSDIDKQLAGLDAELADGSDIRVRLRALDGQAAVLKQAAIGLVIDRRGEFVEASRATAAAEREAAATARAALGDWATARAANAAAWAVAAIGLEQSQPLPFWGRVSGRRIAETPADWIDLAPLALREMSTRQFASPGAVVALVAAYLESGRELPSGAVPADALQTRPGVYRDACTGREERLDAQDLARPATRQRVTPEDGFAQLVFVRSS